MGCGFNWSMQHLISNDREEDIENEAAIKDLLYRGVKGVKEASPSARKRRKEASATSEMG